MGVVGVVGVVEVVEAVGVVEVVGAMCRRSATETGGGVFPCTYGSASPRRMYMVNRPLCRYATFSAVGDCEFIGKMGDGLRFFH